MAIVLAAVTELGELRIWTTKDWQESVLLQPGQDKQLDRPLFFQNENRLVSTQVTDGKRSLKFWDLAKGSSQRHGYQHEVLQEICELKPNELATADLKGDVLLWPQGKKGIRLRDASKSPESVITAVATTKGQRIIVATSDRSSRGATLEYWDATTRKLLERTQVFAQEPIRAVAVNPAGTLAAFSGGQQHEIRLVSLQDESGELIDKPFSLPPAAKVVGEGIRSWDVACSPEVGSYECAFETVQGAGDDGIVFDPSTSSVRKEKLEVDQWRTGATDAGPFSIKMDVVKCNVEVRKNNQAYKTIQLTPLSEGNPKSYCWIATEETSPPVAVAIGTDNQNGVFVYGLTPQGNDGRLPLLRYFRDHQGAVSGLATTADRKYLVSVSADQTAKIWSLEGLLTKNGFHRCSAWGAVLVQKDAQTLKVKSALKAGIAYARKLRSGTEIVKIERYGGGKNIQANTALQMLDVVNQSPLWSGLIVHYKSPGNDKVEAVYITPAWEPLLTTFFAQTGEWAAWTSTGYYNSSPLGDELFGWQLNPATQFEGQPKFFQSAQWREDFEKPNAIEKLLSSGNIDDALAASALKKTRVTPPVTLPVPDNSVATALKTKTELEKNLAANETLKSIEKAIETVTKRPAQKVVDKAPKVNPPKAEPPKVAEQVAPEIVPVEVSPPKVEPPKVAKQVAKQVDPKVDPPKASPPKASPPKVDLPQVAKKVAPVEAPPVELPKPPPAPVHIEIVELSPGIKILSPADSEELEGITIDLAVQLDIQAPATIDDYEIRGTLHGANLGEPEQEVLKAADGSRVICRWTTSMPDGLVDFKVTATPASKKHNYFWDRVFFDAISLDPSSELPRMFIVGIAADSYRGDLRLKFPYKDAQSVLDRLTASTTKNYQPEAELIHNQQISKELFPDKVDELLEDLAETARPQDLLVVYIAGHGTAKDGEYFFIPPDPAIDSYEKLDRDCKEYGVPWEVIASLADSGCQTIFMLDTCYAGDVLEGAKARIRPLASRQAMVLSSSSAGQLAYEDGDKLKHGLFCWCLLEALDMKADENEDDVVDLDELIAYVQHEVLLQSVRIIKQDATTALASARGAIARGAGAALMPQRPVFSKHNFGSIPIATPTD